MSIVFPAIILGFFGSLHCIGMCGPIALILPVQGLNGIKKMSGILLYNMGRITAYAGMGLFFGWIGRQFYIGGLQQWLSVALGFLLIAMICFKQFLPVPKLAFVRSLLGKLLVRQRFGTLYAIGFLNGFLPCGLVYLAISGALASGDILSGMLVMAAFGAGTLPAMVAISWFGQLISVPLRQRIRQLAPVAMAIMAALLILRGLGLGIPYVSPVMKLERTFIHCHK